MSSDPEKNEKAEKKRIISEVYPWSIFATDPMIELLSETNRLN
jgi:hypothetical protein